MMMMFMTVDSVVRVLGLWGKKMIMSEEEKEREILV